MNHVAVVDASVVVKVVLQEEFSNHSRRLFTDSREARRPIVAPPHLGNEVIRAIYKKLQARSITLDEADEALDHFSRLPIQRLEPPDLYQRAFHFARDNSLRATYDSIYVALAQMLSAELWSDDRQLIRKVRLTAPWVHWIGSYPIQQPAP